MSIAECYVINVQCDGQAHGPAFIPRDQFTGNSKRAAMANLRDCGWKLGPNHTAYCRECKLPAHGVTACPESGKHCNWIAGECQTCGETNGKRSTSAATASGHELPDETWSAHALPSPLARRRRTVDELIEHDDMGLLRALPAMRRDAARYRWLRDCSGADLRTLLGVGDLTSLDAFIDQKLTHGVTPSDGGQHG